MNTVNSKLAKIKELGLVISDDNKGCKVTTQNASDYVHRELEDCMASYVLGNVLGDTESLQKAEYDICFLAVENQYDNLSSDYYHSLHELAEANNTEVFREYLKKLHKQYADENDESVYKHMEGEVHDYMTDIENELDEIILALGGEL